MAKNSVTKSLEQRIYDLIYTLLEQLTNENKKTLSEEAKDAFDHIVLAKDLQFDEILNFVQLKDLSMRRLKRTTLEGLIIKVWQIVQEDEKDELGDLIRRREENDNEAFDQYEDANNLMEYKDTNTLNKSVVSLWKNTNDDYNSNSSQENPIKVVEQEVVEKEVVEKEVDEESKKRKHKDVTKVNKKSKKDYTPPNFTLNSLGGMEKVTTELMELIGLPILHPEIYLSTGVEPPRGVLLYGPPGCGKTTIANALAGELKVPFINISAPSIVSGMSGESEKKLRELFDDAKAIAPCLIFMDEIDAITPKRDGGAQREMEKRIVAQLLTLMDELTLDKTNGKPIIVIGATNRPDSLDLALRRAGRFDREICLNVPNEEQRVAIFKTMTANLKLHNRHLFNFKNLAKLTPGFVGADLKSLVTAAGIFAIKRIFESLSEQQEQQDQQGHRVTLMGHANDSMEIDNLSDLEKLSIIQRFLNKHPLPLTEAQLEPLTIDFQDFLDALPTIQPTAKREGFATVPDVTWDNVGALNHIRMELHMCIVQPIKKPEIYEKVGITAPAGVLMWGPPGCGKTLLAKAVANESRANFISIKGPELLNKYVGESERAIRQVFQRARASIPCIIFFDELDALIPKRDSSLSESSSRVVNTLLTELDGLNDRKGVFVIGATNRPDIIDPAMIRPGRLDKSLFIQLPTLNERLDILKTLIKVNNTPIDESVDLLKIVNDYKCRNFSGADLSALVREAGVIALKRKFFRNQQVNQLDKLGFIEDDDIDNEDIFVIMEDFIQALGNINPSVSDEDRLKYERLNQKMTPVAEKVQ